jgi:hypothetical protein
MVAFPTRMSRIEKQVAELHELAEEEARPPSA